MGRLKQALTRLKTNDKAGPTPLDKDGNFTTYMRGPTGAASKEYSTSTSPSPKSSPTYVPTHVMESKITRVDDADEANTEIENLEAIDAGLGPIPPKKNNDKMRIEDEDHTTQTRAQSRSQRLVKTP